MARHLSRLLADAIKKADGERAEIIERVAGQASLTPGLMERVVAGDVVPNEEQVGLLTESLSLDRTAVNEAMERDESFDDPLTEGELNDLGPVIEVANPIIKPRKGSEVFDKDGCVRVSVMRPCISRGRRIRGLPPIYEASMLAKNAAVFNNWPMFMDHVTESLREELQEALRKRGRSVSELGGRVVEGWWDPDVVFEDDEEYGFGKGGIVAKVLPQPAAEAIIKADPDALHCSINAYPTGVRPGVSMGVKGALIEGIRRKPMGSVDWVPRGGAGGRVIGLAEEAVEQHILELVESWAEDLPLLEKGDRRLGSGKRRSLSAERMADLSDYTSEELREHIEENHPDLVEALAEADDDGDKGEKGKGKKDKPAPAKPAAKDKNDDAPAGLTEADMDEREEQLREEFNKERVAEREATIFSAIANEMIRESGLPRRHRGDLLARYSVMASGPADGLKITESDLEEDESREDGFRRLLQEDLDHCAELVREASGGPAVRGQGRNDGNTEITEGDEDEFVELAKESNIIAEDDELDAIVEELIG